MEKTAVDTLQSLLQSTDSTMQTDWENLTALRGKLSHLHKSEQIYINQRINDLMEYRNNYRNELQYLHDSIVSQESELSDSPEPLTSQWFTDMKNLASNLDEMVRPQVMLLLNTLAKKVGDTTVPKEELEALVKQLYTELK